MKKHRWDKSNTKAFKCLKCRCIKYRASERLTMAITFDGKSHYKYIQHWEYIPLDGDVTKELPSCI